MSGFFFKPFKAKTPGELSRGMRDALLTLDSRNASSDARLLEKAAEEIEKNLLAMKQIFLGDGETEPNLELIQQLTSEVCKEDLLELLVYKLPGLNWEARRDLAHVWCSLLRQSVGPNQCCMEYVENHQELLDFLVSCYENKEIALNAGAMLRECARYPNLSKYMLESPSFDLFFRYVQSSNFDISSDAFTTFKELLTRNEGLTSAFLSSHYSQFFGLYDRLLSSSNYVTRRQSLKLLGDLLLEKQNTHVMMQFIAEEKNLKTIMILLKDPTKSIQSLAFDIFKVFVANPNKPGSIVKVLVKNREKLLLFLENFHFEKEDDQFEEEKEIVVKTIEGLTLT